MQINSLKLFILLWNSFNCFYIFRLKTIDFFESCSIQVGDTHWYTIKDTDNLMAMKQWQSKCTEGFNIGTGSTHSKTNKYKHHKKRLGIKKPSKRSRSIGLGRLNIDDLLLSMYTRYIKYM